MREKNGKLNKIIIIIVILFYAIPFYILTTTSLKTDKDISSKWKMPSYLYLDNFINAWQKANLGHAFLNNLIILAVSMAGLIVLGSLAAYPLARNKSKLNKFMYYLFVSAMIVPPLTILVPLYQFYSKIHAMNTFWGITLMHLTFQLPLTIFLYTGFIGTIPRELDEAALIDGCSRFGLFFKILFPLLKPVTATITIVTGVNIWNDYQFSLFFLQKSQMHTITVTLSRFFGEHANYISWVAAGSLLGSIPMIIIYLFLQKYFISGLSSGAVKG